MSTPSPLGITISRTTQEVFIPWQHRPSLYTKVGHVFALLTTAACYVRKRPIRGLAITETQSTVMIGAFFVLAAVSYLWGRFCLGKVSDEMATYLKTRVPKKYPQLQRFQPYMTSADYHKAEQTFFEAAYYQFSQHHKNYDTFVAEFGTSDQLSQLFAAHADKKTEFVAFCKKNPAILFAIPDTDLVKWGLVVADIKWWKTHLDTVVANFGKDDFNFWSWQDADLSPSVRYVLEKAANKITDEFIFSVFAQSAPVREKFYSKCGTSFLSTRLVPGFIRYLQNKVVTEKVMQTQFAPELKELAADRRKFELSQRIRTFFDAEGQFIKEQRDKLVSTLFIPYRLDEFKALIALSPEIKARVTTCYQNLIWIEKQCYTSFCTPLEVAQPLPMQPLETTMAELNTCQELPEKVYVKLFARYSLEGFKRLVSACPEEASEGAMTQTIMQGKIVSYFVKISEATRKQQEYKRFCDWLGAVYTPKTPPVMVSHQGAHPPKSILHGGGQSEGNEAKRSTKGVSWETKRDL